MYSRVECCVFAVGVCLSSKSRNGFGVCMYVYPYFICYLYSINVHFYLLLARYKLCVV